MYSWRQIEIYRVYRGFERSLATYDNLWHAKKWEKNPKFSKKNFFEINQNSSRNILYTPKKLFWRKFYLPRPNILGRHVQTRLFLRPLFLAFSPVSLFRSLSGEIGLFSRRDPDHPRSKILSSFDQDQNQNDWSTVLRARAQFSNMSQILRLRFE